MSKETAALAASYRCPSPAELAEFVKVLKDAAEVGRLMYQVGGRLYPVQELKWTEFDGDWVSPVIDGIAMQGCHVSEISRFWMRRTFTASLNPLQLPWLEGRPA